MKMFLMSLSLLSLSSTSFSANQYDYVLSTESLFSVVSQNVETKFEETLLNPEGFLKRFNPAGVTVTKKVVLGNEFEFIVVKRILGFPKQFHLKGSVNFERTASGCSTNQTAYLAHLDFTPSGPSITDTIADFTLLFCSTNASPTNINVKSTNTLYYKGDKFGGILERLAKSLMNDQVDAIVTSLNGEVASK